MKFSQLKTIVNQQNTLKSDLHLLDESVEIPENVSIEHINTMFDAAKRALGIANKLKDPADRKKHMGRVMSGLNKIRTAIRHLSK